MSVEVKIQCDCGTRYKFEVMPLHGRMPQKVSCPGCGLDGTPAANESLRASVRPRGGLVHPLLRGGFAPGVAGAAVAGLVAMFAWFLLVRVTGHQLGFAAWGVGLLTGLGARGLGREGSRRLGLAAGACAGAAILGGQIISSLTRTAPAGLRPSGEAFDWLTLLWLLVAVMSAFKLGSHRAPAS